MAAAHRKQDLSPVVDLLRQLIRIPSPNPPGNTRAIADFCERFLQSAGFQTIKVAPDDRAWSVVGMAGHVGDAALGASNRPSIMFHAHIDTVPLGQNAQWSHDPFGGEIENGQ